MNTAAIVVAPLVEFAAIFGVIALVATPIYIFLEKTNVGARFKAVTPWMGWTETEEIEDMYTNFRIHPRNYIKVPTSR